jgi:acetyltransferase-like isoleucine patch superfamily enzyme
MSIDYEQLLIIGSEPMISKVKYITEENEKLRVKLIEIHQQDFFNFNFNLLDPYPKDRWKICIASDNFALNFARLNLTAHLMNIGYKFANVISKKTLINPSTKVAGSLIAFPGVIVSSKTSLGVGVILNEGVFIGHGTTLDRFVYVDSGARIGEKSIIKQGVSVGTGVCLNENSVVGRHCELLLHTKYDPVIPARTYFSDQFPKGMTIYQL